MSQSNPFLIVIDYTTNETPRLIRNPRRAREILGDIARQVESETNAGASRGQAFPKRAGGKENEPPARGQGIDNEAYCVKCRQRQSVKGMKRVKSANGRNMLQGICTICGTKITKFTK